MFDGTNTMIDIGVAQQQQMALRHKPKRNELPKYILEIVSKLGLSDIEDHNTRATIFLRHMKSMKRVCGKTIDMYFRRMKAEYFPNTTIAPDQKVFDIDRPEQSRCPKFTDIDRLIQYILAEFNAIDTDTLLDNKQNAKKYTKMAAILLAAYTGLRLSELLKLTYFTLKEMHEKKPPKIKLKRKYGDEWTVFYSEPVTNLIEKLYNSPIFSGQMNNTDDFTLQTKPLFGFKSKILSNTLLHYYLLAIGERPSPGFGFHSFRYYIASKLHTPEQNNDNLEHVRLVLGHKNTRTTRRYLRVDAEKIGMSLASFEINKYFED